MPKWTITACWVIAYNEAVAAAIVDGGDGGGAVGAAVGGCEVAVVGVCMRQQ